MRKMFKPARDVIEKDGIMPSFLAVLPLLVVAVFTNVGLKGIAYRLSPKLCIMLFIIDH